MDNLLHDIPHFFYEIIPRSHIVLELLLGVLTIWFLFKKKETKNIGLTEEEKEKVLSSWVPEELVSSSEGFPADKERVVQSKFGKYVTINDKKCLNLASFSFLGLSEHPDIEESAVKSVQKYGVGSCGPRGFYGTVDVHLILEDCLAKFMGMEEAVVYSYGFSTIASAIPAYAKRGDIVFVDEEVNFAIQKGLDASRSEIKFFKHNDMNDLEKLLAEQEKIDLKNKKKAAKTRKFLLVEGIYMKTGQICPLPELISLRKKYKLRILIDESISFGTLGKHGKGVTDHFNIPVIEVDLIMASMECALASVGGFCVGSSFIVEHQRLAGLGYCFSASLPPLLTTAATTALDIIQNNPQIVLELQNTCSSFHDELLKSKILTTYSKISGDRLSPIKHLQVTNTTLLDRVVDICEENNVAVTRAAYLAERKQPIPSIRLSINRLLTVSEIKDAIAVIEEAFKKAYFVTESRDIDQA